MITRQETAFSKLMIAGEYAALFGSSALVSAVDRQAHCSFFAGNQWEFVEHLGSKASSSKEHPLFLSVIKSLADDGLFLAQGKYVLDTSAFFGNRGQKLGLGSSAAATVALCKMAFLKNPCDPSRLYSVACHAHRHLFGYGSGADIAASLYGGSFFFRRCDTSPDIRNHDLSSLWKNFVFVDVKKPQSTQRFVEAVLRIKESAPAFIKDFCQSSDDACEQLRGDFTLTSSIKIFDTLYALLGDLGKRATIDIISDQHQQVFSIAKKWGGSAKPSGAGGGDIALALVPEENHQHFRQEMRDKGFDLIDLNIAPPSLHVVGTSAVS